ncbi:uncharacterized protein LOC103488141 isoform X2 [Cucumis melo]|uniref:Uncharacterized protein LOC103488141 isoform X2 n=1 Tax=Cucumis melo TaxID=3656 RepID=A0A1S3BCF8_CUCME|nr:uncharacterized protein LOC103488141 isoform X2 [Cucumis melo]
MSISTKLTDKLEESAGQQLPPSIRFNPSPPTMWDDCHAGLPESFPPQYDQESFTNFDLFTAATKFKDYYKTLEVDYDATDDDIRANYIRLALKWHPDKQKNQDVATSRFQEINEAYQGVRWRISIPCEVASFISLL